MPAEPTPLRVQLAGEDSAHEVLLRHLSDAVIGSEHLDQDTLDQLRCFLEAVNNGKRQRYFSTRDATARLRQLLNIPRGRPYYRSPLLDGRPVGSAAEIVDTIACINKEQDDVEVVLLLIDEDGSAQREADALRAQEHFERDSGQLVLIGICAPTAEGWLVPLIGQADRERVTSLQAQLSFNPVKQPNRLNTDKTSSRNAKRVLHALLAPHPMPLDALPSGTPSAADTDAALSALVLNPTPEVWPAEGGLRDFLTLLRDRYHPKVEERG